MLAPSMDVRFALVQAKFKGLLLLGGQSQSYCEFSHAYFEPVLITDPRAVFGSLYDDFLLSKVSVFWAKTVRCRGSLS